MNLLVTPITQHLNLRLALLITFPGFYVVGGLLFLATLGLYSIRGNPNASGARYSEKDGGEKDKEAALALNASPDETNMEKAQLEEKI